MNDISNDLITEIDLETAVNKITGRKLVPLLFPRPSCPFAFFPHKYSSPSSAKEEIDMLE